ncbi:MAG: amino acid aminotransferase [Planctomycetota bacterium]
MFENVASLPPDPILGLSEAFKKDTRENKMNLTVGVYKDEAGNTPLLNCVHTAEKQLCEAETSKIYLGIDGLATFHEHARNLTLGDLIPQERVSVFQTPGGTGALRVAGDFLGTAFAGSRVWLSTPTWPNHPSIFSAAGLQVESYPYLASDGRTLDFAAMMDHLEGSARPGDILCMHGCCHNPSGVDLNEEQWAEVAALSAKKEMLPLIDFAYQGFGKGLEEDRVSLKAIAAAHQEFLVCSSYSKNFGLYGERIGALLAVAPEEESNARLKSNIKRTIRVNYSNPPKHGAAIVAQVLGCPDLRTQWEAELSEMRNRIHAMRSGFVEAMQARNCEVDFSFLLSQSGMFSFSGLNPMQVDWLKTEKAIYIVGSGRINVAGLSPQNMEYFADSVLEATKI